MGFIFNFIKRIIKLTFKLTLYVAIFATIVTLIPNLPPYTKFTSIELAPTQERVGPLALNNALNNAEQKLKGKLLGPEAFQLVNGELYTSLATGEIVKISPGGHITFVTKVGQPCTGLSQEHICGRPLGFQIDDKGQTIYVADAYHGIWKVDLKTERKHLLVSPHVEINKRQPKLFNSIALAKNGDFYWTDSSSDFQLKDGAISALTDPSGRVFYYNAAKNESTVLIDDLWFANGLVLSPNNEFLVISETCKFRLLKHYIAGPKKGKTEVFIEGLPGAPDNVRVLPDGSGVLVALYTVFDDENPLLLRSMSSTPVLRKFLARLQRLIEVPFEYLNSVYPHIILEEIVYYIGHFKSASGLMPAQSGLLQVDWNGKIVASYFNTDSSIKHISDAIVYNDKLYTGNPHAQDFIGAVPVPAVLKKAFEPVNKAGNAKPQQAKPAEQAKPKEEPKVKVNTPEPKPKLEQKPIKQNIKVEEKVKEQAPKVEQKPKVAPKVAEPVQTAKPTVQTTTTTPPPPKTTPPPARPATTETQKKTPQAEKQPQATTPKPEAKTSPPPKPSPTTALPTQKATTTTKKTEEPTTTQKPINQKASKSTQGKVKEQIPIKEEITSDTSKPTVEKLKVIKKGGVPTEMPIPSQ